MMHEPSAPNSQLYHDYRERITGETWLERANAPIWRSDLPSLARSLGRSCVDVMALLDAENELAKLKT